MWEAEPGVAEGVEPYLSVHLHMGRVQVSAGGLGVSSPMFLCDGHKQQLQVEIQEDQVFFSHAGFHYPLGSIAPVTLREGDMVYVGGLPEVGVAAKWGDQFKGCLQDVRLDDVHLDVDGWNSTINVTTYIPNDAENVLPSCISDDMCKVLTHTPVIPLLCVQVQHD